MIKKQDIDSGFSFYNINEKFKPKCYECAEEINKNQQYLNAFNKVYKLLNNNNFEEIKKIWNIKEIDELFCNNINHYVTNLMIIINYKNHKNNIKKYDLSDEQINIHKFRVKECFENDLINRNYDSIRISQMLWAIYFIRIRLIEIGRLQYEYENTINGLSQIKIHIPSGNRLDIKMVIESINKSKNLLPKIFNIDNMEFLCNSWLLSNQLNELIDSNTNIYKFYQLFDVVDGDDCVDDILNFVYSLKECKNYNMLPEITNLQKLIKYNLINNKIFKLGMGKLK